MITYLVKYYDKLLNALAEHIMIVLITLVLSVVLASVLTILAMYFQWISRFSLDFFHDLFHTKPGTVCYINTGDRPWEKYGSDCTGDV